MLLRLSAAAMLATTLGLAGPALGREPASAKTPPPTAAAPPNKAVPAPSQKEPASASTPAKQRQKACAAEWRAFSAAEKTAQGPNWPQFYSKCVKRLKAQKD